MQSQDSLTRSRGRVLCYFFFSSIDHEAPSSPFVHYKPVTMKLLWLLRTASWDTSVNNNNENLSFTLNVPPARAQSFVSVPSACRYITRHQRLRFNYIVTRAPFESICLLRFLVFPWLRNRWWPGNVYRDGTARNDFISSESAHHGPSIIHYAINHPINTHQERLCD